MDFMIELIALTIAGVIFWLFADKKQKNENRKDIPYSVKQWESKVKQASEKIGVPYPIAMAVLWVESAGDEYARGSNQEYGLYQLKQIAVEDVRQMGYGDFSLFKSDVDDNIDAGLSYLHLQNRRTGSWEKAIKAYNQGQTGAKRYPERAQEYYDKVNQRIKYYV